MVVKFAEVVLQERFLATRKCLTFELFLAVEYE